MGILDRVLIAVTLIVLATASAHAVTLTVTNTNDSGPGSLREAILAANANSGTDTIAFNIPGAGPHSIQPLSGLPTVTDSLTIDGYTQPGAIANTNPPGLGNNAVLKIELDGSNTFSSNGLDIAAANSTVRGLVINRFFRGLGTLGFSAAGSEIQGNFIGTDVSGTLALGNSNGIRMDGASDITIGGTLPDQGNLISGNGVGIRLIGSTTTDNRIEGNLIGTDVTGTANLGNHDGISIESGARLNIIGGAASGAGNIISWNGGSGVVIVQSSQNLLQANTIRSNGLGGVLVAFGVENAIRSNTIFANEGLGIDLLAGFNPDGVTPNDPMDFDSGPNNFQNFPVLSSATVGGNTTIEGGLNSTPDTEFQLQFFSNAECDPSGHGEGENFLGSMLVTTNGSGDSSFSATLPQAITAGQFITATATDSDNNTSEFSQCLGTAAVPVHPVIFGASHIGPEGNSTLHRINPLTGAATAVGSGIGFQRVSGMDFDPATGILFATGEREAGDLDVNVLMTINVNTGVGTEVGPTGVVDFAGVFADPEFFEGVFSDLSFRPTDHTLFGFSFPGQWVATIDLATGEATQLAFETVIGDRGIEANGGNALAFLDSVLVHAGSTGEGFPESPSCAPDCFSALHEIDLATDMATTFAALDFPFVAGFHDHDVPRANGMDFHSASGTLFASIVYGFGGDRATFFGTIQQSGDVTLIGQTKTGMDALAVISSVIIDIKPGSDPNSINPELLGVIPVAILTTSTADGDALDFDATQVDATTLAFGPDRAGIAHPQGHVVDIDEDGDADLVVHFEIKETGIQCGDTETTLTGATFGAEPIMGTDTVNTVGCAAACISPPSGLVSWWPGDGNALDIIGPNDGTPLNGATFAPGLVDQAFSFDGVDDFVAAPQTAITSDLQELTVDAWVKHGSLPVQIQRYITIGGPQEVVLRHNGSGQLHFFLRIGGVLHHVQVNGVLQVGVFHHVAGTFDGSIMRLYLDGVELASLAVSGTIAPPTFVNLSSPVETMDGLLDEIEIYDRALTAAEIAAIFAAGEAGKCK